MNHTGLKSTDEKNVCISFICYVNFYCVDCDPWMEGKNELAECLSSGQSDENPPYLVGIAVVSFAPYATFLFSWDYAIIIADKSCLLPWLQIDARGTLKLAFPLQKSSFYASCSGFNPLCLRFHSFCNVYFLFKFPPLPLTHEFFSCISICLQQFDIYIWFAYSRLKVSETCIYNALGATLLVNTAEAV